MVVKSFLLLAKTLQLFRRTLATDRNTDSEAMEIAKAANFAHWDSLDISNYLPRSLYPSVFEKFN